MITVHSIALEGLSPLTIEVEVSFVRGQPQLLIIGLPNRILTEAKERIAAAVGEQGIRLSARKMLVNLAPADVKKTASYYELAIAVGLLRLHGQMPSAPANTAYFGEFSLSGRLKPLKQVIPLLLGAKSLGFSSIVLPDQSLVAAQHIPGLKLFPLKSLGQLTHPNFFHTPQLSKPQKQPLLAQASLNCTDPLTARVLSIAAAGGHNVLLVGPPGIGKTTTLQNSIQILPPLTTKERLEVLALHATAGVQRSHTTWHRPLRAPHHSSSQTSILGGGSILKPGEISLAHAGVLLLDEFTEFSRPVLEALRQPVSEHSVRISRNKGTVTYPAMSLVLASCNPCPCGYFQSDIACRCTPHQIQQYRHRVSGPLLDRFDLQLFQTKSNTTTANSHQVHQQKISEAFVLQQTRYRPLTGLQATNGKVSYQLFQEVTNLPQKTQQHVAEITQSLQLSLRKQTQIVRIAQTIADLASQSHILPEHINEALQYRLVW